MKVGLRRWSAFGLVLTAAVLVAASPAAASRRTFEVRGGSMTFARIHGTHGYTVNFSEAERKDKFFKLTARSRGATVTYLMSGGRLRDGGIDAGLGDRGRFDLRFVPEGKLRTLRFARGCGGPPGHWQRGYLVGVARFHGERAYTDARARRIPAITESYPPYHCHYVRHRHRRQVRPDRERVHASGKGVDFFASLAPKSAAGPRVSYRALEYERSGRLTIDREADVPAPEKTFDFTGGSTLPEEVEVSPPAPFTGSAAFTRTPESTFTWTGDLTVEFPGNGPVALAGPRFGAEVCALEACVRQESEVELPR